MATERKLSFEDFRKEIISFVEENSVPTQADETAPEAKEVFLQEIFKNYFHELDEEVEGDPQYFSDNRIQAALYSESWDTLYLFISDYSGKNVDFQSVYPSEEAIMNRFENTTAALRYALTAEYKNKFEESDPLFELCKIICEHRDVIRTIKIYLITDAQVLVSDQPKKEYPEYTIEYYVRNLYSLYEKYRAPSEEALTAENNIELSEFGVSLPCLPVSFGDAETEYQSYLAVVPGVLLAKLYRDYNEKILQGNIRVFLQAKRPINKGIKASLEGKSESKTRFFAYNNGISATAEAVEIRSDGDRCFITAIKNFQIVNGGQTTASIHNVWKEHKFDDTFLDGVYVQMKLTVVSKPALLNELVPQIAQYSNTQNAVSKADFVSNEEFYTSLQNLSRKIFNPDGKSKWFYERISGQYGEDKRLCGDTKKAVSAFEAEYPSNHKVSKTDVGLYYMAWKKKPFSAAHGGIKNFKNYVAELKSAAPDKDTMPTPDADYYKEMVALSLLFKRLDELVRAMFKERGITGGPKQQVVIYTLSLLSHLTDGQLNLKKIWAVQKDASFYLPENLEEYLRKLCLNVYTYLENWKPSGKISSEWTKRDDCWILLRDEKEDYHIPFPQELSSYLLTAEEAESHKKWIHSLYPKPPLEETDNRGSAEETTSPDSAQVTERNEDKPVDEKAPPETPQGTDTEPVDSSSIIAEDLRKSLSNGSVMQLSKLLSTLQTKPEIDDDSLQPLRRIIAIRRSHHTVPQNLIEEFLQNLKNNSETNLLSNTESSTTSKEIDNVTDEKQIYDDSIKSPVFEARSRKGGSGKLIVGENREFILLKGSVIPLIDTPSMRQGLIDKRDKWIADSSIVINQDKITATLAVDIVMHSSSEAAQLITANSTNGKTYWKCNGITLDDYLKKMGIND